MTSTQWEHQPEVRDALRVIVSDPQLGVPTLSNSQAMSNLLKDLLPDAPRETSVLVAAAEAGLPQMLTDHVAQGMDLATASSLTSSAFAARTPFTQDACVWAVAELAVALGLAPAPGPGEPPRDGAAGRSFPPGPPAGEAPGPLGGGPQDGSWPLGGRGQPGSAGQGSAGQGSVGQGSVGQGNVSQPGPAGQGGVPGQPGGPGQPPQGGYGSWPQNGYAPPQAGWPQGQPQPEFGAPPRGRFAGPGASAAQTMPPPGAAAPGGPGGAAPGGLRPGAAGPAPMVPGMAGGVRTGPPGAGQGMAGWPGPPPGRRPTLSQRIPKWAYWLSGVVVLLLVAAIGLAIQHRHNAAVEPLSKIIKPDIVRCHPASKLSMHGVTASLACSTSESVIGISAYQYGSAADFRAGLSHLDSITGWDPSAAGRQCPPPVGRSIGHEGWHTLFNPRYKTLRADQILQCYTDNGLFLYLWTLPSQRVILVAGDSASGASYTELQNWWNKLTYG